MQIPFLKKKNVILASLMVLLVVASYINYNAYSGDFTASSENDNPLNAKLVNSLTEDEIMSGDKAVSASFFIDYRIERDAKRSEDIQTLKSITASSSSTEENIAEANEVMIELVQLSQEELQLENMIVSKGYEDCVVFLHDDYVNVLIKGDTLTTQQAVQIQDIVAKQCKMPLSQIYIASTGVTQ
ncbi:MAG: SpoIIIAH-like family protein [Anaerofustis stercorihominis]|nr:SpoIIIAH-like family protein [Anaerofustis stercorihominis]